MGTSAYYAPAAGSVQMAEAIIKDKRRILPCAAFCKEEYGGRGVFRRRTLHAGGERGRESDRGRA